MEIQSYLDELLKLAVAYAPKVLLALLTLWIGFKISRSIVKAIDKIIEKREIDPSLRRFFWGLVSIIFKTLVILSVISILGIETTSFVAILASAGFAIGMALQGSLGNFAGGVIILIFKPFKAGDYIEAQGFSGTVDSIQVFNTILKTPDNKTVIIPNGGLSSGALINYSTEDTRRVDLLIGIGYDDDIKKAKELMLSLIEADERILKAPEPAVRVAELADSSVNFTVRMWCRSSDYWDIYFEMTELIKIEFDKNNISIPYPQTDIHIHNNN